MTNAIPSRSPLRDDEFPTPAERMHGFRVGETVRVTVKPDQMTGRVGVVDMVTDDEFGVHVALDGQVLAYRPSELERAAGVFQRGDRVVLTYCDAEHPGTVTALSEMPGMRSIVVRFDELDDDGETVHAVDSRDLRHETSDGGAVPSPAPPSDPTDPAAVGEVPPITPADIPGLYVVSENTAVRPPDSARHRFSSQAGHAANVAGAALVRAQAIAMDRIHQAIDAGQAESRRLGDLDDAAQAIVDAADVWADAEGDVDATLTLSEAVQAWRAVRDGGRA